LPKEQPASNNATKYFRMGKRLWQALASDSRDR
jgi:hypothetical protein